MATFLAALKATISTRLALDFIARFMNKNDLTLRGLTIFNNILHSISIHLTSNIHSDVDPLTTVVL